MNSSLPLITRTITIDPGWRTLGILIVEYDHIKEEIRKFSQTFDLGLKNACTDVLKMKDALDIFWERISQHFPSRFDHVIIELQPAVYKKNRKLQVAIENLFLYRNLEKGKIHRISPISVKKNFQLEFGDGNHAKHKKDVVKLVQENENMIFHSKKLTDNHQADCIALYNVFLKTHKKLLAFHATYSEINTTENHFIPTNNNNNMTEKTPYNSGYLNADLLLLPSGRLTKCPYCDNSGTNQWQLHEPASGGAPCWKWTCLRTAKGPRGDAGCGKFFFCSIPNKATGGKIGGWILPTKYREARRDSGTLFLDDWKPLDPPEGVERKPLSAEDNRFILSLNTRTQKDYDIFENLRATKPQFHDYFLFSKYAPDWWYKKKGEKIPPTAFRTSLLCHEDPAGLVVTENNTLHVNNNSRYSSPSSSSDSIVSLQEMSNVNAQLLALDVKITQNNELIKRNQEILMEMFVLVKDLTLASSIGGMVKPMSSSYDLEELFMEHESNNQRMTIDDIPNSPIEEEEDQEDIITITQQPIVTAAPSNNNKKRRTPNEESGTSQPKKKRLTQRTKMN